MSCLSKSTDDKPAMVIDKERKKNDEKSPDFTTKW